MSTPKKSYQHVLATGKDESLAALKDLEARIASGDLRCVALRLFKADGTWEDVVIGGDSDEERAAALADLHAARGRGH